MVRRDAQVKSDPGKRRERSWFYFPLIRRLSMRADGFKLTGNFGGCIVLGSSSGLPLRPTYSPPSMCLKRFCVLSIGLPGPLAARDAGD